MPNAEEGVVSRTVCSRGHRNACEKHHTVQVKNCKQFVVYYLTRTSGCEEAYCFGNILHFIKTREKDYMIHIN